MESGEENTRVQPVTKSKGLMRPSMLFPSALISTVLFHLLPPITCSPALVRLAIYFCDRGKSVESTARFCFCLRAIALADKNFSGCFRLYAEPCLSFSESL